jgi:methylthioribulose-1-phosphate dehydratase
MKPCNLYVLDKDQKVVKSPVGEPKLKPSQCTPLFFNAYNLRDAGACIHTHSQNAVMATLFFGEEFVITHQEMIKGIKKGSSSAYHKYYDTITVPIIENTPEECDLKERMEEAMVKYPMCNAVLVR